MFFGAFWHEQAASEYEREIAHMMARLGQSAFVYCALACEALGHIDRAELQQALQVTSTDQAFIAVATDKPITQTFVQFLVALQIRVLISPNVSPSAKLLAQQYGILLINHEVKNWAVQHNIYAEVNELIVSGALVEPLLVALQMPPQFELVNELLLEGSKASVKNAFVFLANKLLLSETQGMAYWLHNCLGLKAFWQYFNRLDVKDQQHFGTLFKRHGLPLEEASA